MSLTILCRESSHGGEVIYIFFATQTPPASFLHICLLKIDVFHFCFVLFVSHKVLNSLHFHLI